MEEAITRQDSANRVRHGLFLCPHLWPVSDAVLRVVQLAPRQSIVNASAPGS